MAGRDLSNLDGDFKALNEVKRLRREEVATQGKKSISEILMLVPVENGEESTIGARGSPFTVPDSECTRDELFRAAAANDFEAFKLAWKEVKQRKKDLDSKEYLSPEDNKNVFHSAILSDSKDVVSYIVANARPDALCQSYDITVRRLPASKTALHLLTEKGDLETIRDMLMRIPSGNSKTEYINRTVLTEPEGQRPRHLPAMHIAALLGYTSLVQYYIKNQGVDVNFTNSKEDTAVLWAARGNHIETVRALIRLGADLNHQNDKGSTPLYWACRYGFTEIVNVLVTEGSADVHQQRSLGLVSPIVLTSALGYVDIVKILLHHGADVNLIIQSGFTPLHHAAIEGNNEVVRLLIERGAEIDCSNDFGDTALLLAAQNGQNETVGILAMLGADMEGRNKDGKTVWHYAIDADDDDLLTLVLTCWKKGKPDNIRKIPSLKQKTPLHLAALKGDDLKLDLMLASGIDPNTEDESGNTFIHLAAREGHVRIISKFLGESDINSRNDESETPLHMAARHGHLEVVNLLLKKADLTVCNSSQETVLHVACKSPDASPDLVQLIVDVTVKAHHWSLVNAVDRAGNTALHVAARAGRIDLLPCLKTLNPRIGNGQGDTPLHVAVRHGHFDVLQTIYDLFVKDININQQNHEGETLVHLAALMGDAQIMTYLVHCGASLTTVNKEGNTVLHVLVELYTEDNRNSGTYMHVFKCILNNAVKWWCMKGDLHYPDEDSDIYDTYHDKAVIQLTSQIVNKTNMSVLLYAAKEGAKDILETILHIPDVYFMREGKACIFDVTNLIPDTNQGVSRAKVPGNSISSETLSTLDKNDNVSKVEFVANNSNGTPSLIDLIVRNDNVSLANDMMDIIPLRHLVADIWSMYQSIYVLLMVIHFIYMIFISLYGIPLLDSLPVANSSSSTEAVQAFPNGLYLIWPGVLICYEIYFILYSVYRWSREVGKYFSARDLRKFTPFYVIKHIILTVFDNLAHAANLSFGSLIVSWYILYILEYRAQVEVLGCGIIVGWMCTISFTDGFEVLHSFSIMLKNIILKDIGKFFALYFFVLLAFSFGFQALLWVVPSARADHPHIGHYFFTVFGMMVGSEDFFSFDEDLAALGYPGLTLTIRTVYIIYLILTSIILLNLLIAMMSDSYSAVRAREGTNWRVGSVRLALQIEKSFPIIPALFKCIGVKHLPLHKDRRSDRWHLTLPAYVVKLDKDEDESEVRKSLRRLEQEVHSIKSTMGDLYETIGTLAEKVEGAFGRPTTPSGGYHHRLYKRRTSGNTMAAFVKHAMKNN